MKNLHLLAILIIAISSQNICAQNIKPELSEAEKVQTIPTGGIKLRRVIYGKKMDGFPQSMKVRGVIEEVAIALFSCGIVHWYGTAKIKLLDKVEGYKPEYVYIVTTCFFTTNKEILNKVIEVKLSKLRKWKKSEHGTIMNTIDSGGVAFYRLDKNPEFEINSLKTDSF